MAFSLLENQQTGGRIVKEGIKNRSLVEKMQRFRNVALPTSVSTSEFMSACSGMSLYLQFCISISVSTARQWYTLFVVLYS